MLEKARANALAAGDCGLDRLRPIFAALNEAYSYEQIKIVVAHMQAADRGASGS